MPSGESQLKYVKTAHPRKHESQQPDLLATALGRKLNSQKTSATFWQPLKLFAYSQLTSLVRRATLKENEQVPKYEKVHNFKVRFCCMLNGVSSYYTLL